MPVDDFIAAWNARDPSAVAACFTPGGVRVALAHPETRYEGRDALVEHVGGLMSTWPDCALAVRAVTSGDDGTVTCEWTWTGTQQADYGPLPGRGQALELKGVSVLEMDGDLIREERVYWDTGTLMASAGLFPE
jgi:steroid delta-isomerase-like uncharacterized protein